jgi:hypothetical protein
VPYVELHENVCTMAGIDPETVQRVDRLAMQRSIARALRAAWESYPWPELVVTEQRFWRPQWVAAQVYEVGAEVWHGEGYWRAIGQAQAGQSPAIAPQLWEVLQVQGGTP